ncbi:hypothetical protein KC221_30215, partial [Mycobacterium tuberculosis]|nr:hypothetical protein [Mycobacterium tuberculosis]
VGAIAQAVSAFRDLLRRKVSEDAESEAARQRAVTEARRVAPAGMAHDLETSVQTRAAATDAAAVRFEAVAGEPLSVSR